MKQLFRKKLFWIGSFAVVVLAVVLFFLLRDDSTIRYGYYEHINQDGSISSIRLLENSVYCDNLNFEDAEQGVALHMIDEVWKANADADPNDNWWDSPEYVTLFESYKAQLNFTEIFDQKEVFTIEIERDDDDGVYWIFVRVPNDNTYGLNMLYDMETRKLFFLTDEFKYAGRNPS